MNPIKHKGRRTDNGDKIKNLKVGDTIAFAWPYGIFGDTIIVDKISLMDEDRFCVHFLFGYKSEAEWINKPDILAIGNMEATGTLEGWTGKYDILQPEHPLIKK